MDHNHSPPHADAPLASLQARLEQLPCLGRLVTIEPLTGGITNRNFRVHAAAGTFAVRVCEPRPWLGIDRDNEFACQDFAAAVGIAPAVVHREADLLISDWVNGHVLTSADLHQIDCSRRIVALLKQLHSRGSRVPSGVLEFCPFNTIRSYSKTAESMKSALPETLPRFLSELEQLRNQLAPFRPVLCHNDLLAANWIDDGTRLWLLDWEYAGIGHPFFDLANLSSNASFSAEQDDRLLRAYLAAQPNPAERIDFRVLKALSYLREALWGWIQSASSDIPFDYIAYARTNYDSFLTERGRLPVKITGENGA